MIPLVLAFLLLAPPPEASISGPSRVAPGELVILDASAIEGVTTRSWLLMGTDRLPHVCPDGTHCVWSTSVEGLHEVIFIGAGVDEQGKATLVVAKHSVTVGRGPAPVPDPTPSPPAPTPPPAPVGKYGLDVVIRRAMPQMGGPAERRVQQANIIAKAFRSASTQAAAGVYPGPQEMVDATSTKYRTDLGPEASKAWEPVLGAIRAKLAELALESIPEHVEAWGEIAMTLEATR